MMLGIRRSYLLSAATVAVLAFGGAGCSSLPTVPDWVDPTTWWDSSAPADAGETPDLASIPDKPGTPAADDQQAVAEQLAADRANAKYSAEALRGGAEPSAAPPPDLPVKPKVAEAPKPAPKPVSQKTQAAAAAAADRSIAADPAGASAPGTLPPTAPGIAAAPVAAPVPAPAPAASPSASSSAPPAASAVQTSELPEPPAAKPARQRIAKAAPPPVPAPSAVPAEQPEPAPKPRKAPAATPAISAVSPSDAELGFQPSSAPPLDPSVSQFVSAGVIDRYQHTGSAAAPKPAKKTKVASASLPPEAGAPPAALPPVAGAASSIVYFPGDVVSLNADAKALVHAAAEQFKAQGGQGVIRVVGHSSSRTPNMSAEAHTALVQKKSADRANAVARELIRMGVPAARVQVEAVGDTQPVYYESMPKGEDGNRRVEIFLQG